MNAGELGQNAADLCAREHHRQPLGPLRTDGTVEALEFAAEDVAIQEQDAGQGLVLGRRRDLAAHGEIGQERDDFGGSHLVGVALVVEQDEATNPLYVGLFGPRAHVAQPDRLTHPIEEARRGGLRSGVGRCRLGRITGSARFASVARRVRAGGHRHRSVRQDRWGARPEASPDSLGSSSRSAFAAKRS